MSTLVEHNNVINNGKVLFYENIRDSERSESVYGFYSDAYLFFILFFPEKLFGTKVSSSRHVDRKSHVDDTLRVHLSLFSTAFLSARKNCRKIE